MKNTVLRTITAVQRMTALDCTPRAVVIDVRQADALADLCVSMTQDSLNTALGGVVPE